MQIPKCNTTPYAHDPYPSRVKPVPETLPRRDPVVYSEWTVQSPLTRAQVEAYARDGFLTLRNLLSPSEVACLQREMAALRRHGPASNPALSIQEPGNGDVRSIFKVHETSPVFARLAADRRLIDIARFLLGDDVYIHQSRLNFKPAFRGKEFYWHSDFETWHVEDGMPRMRALSMSVILTPNHDCNGPLMLIAGSHTSYIACVGETPDDHYKQSLKKQEYGVPDDASLLRLAQAGGIATPKGPAGTVVLFDCNVMHGSNSNITPYARSNVFIVYNALSNRLVAPFGGKPPRPDFLAARGKPRPLDGVERERPIR
ncbi:MAG: ectoine hydroxylase [Alphaproteobacteria bacterium]|nr:MAG: ectoine hydroxylase [Alphaproteobacteria bacterium]